MPASGCYSNIGCCRHCHYIVQKYYDKKNDDVYTQAILTQKEDVRDVPNWYAILPCLPIALMIIFSKLVYSAIKLNTISALLLVLDSYRHH